MSIVILIIQSITGLVILIVVAMILATLRYVVYRGIRYEIIPELMVKWRKRQLRRKVDQLGIRERAFMKDKYKAILDTDLPLSTVQLLKDLKLAQENQQRLIEAQHYHQFCPRERTCVLCGIPRRDYDAVRPVDALKCKGAL